MTIQPVQLSFNVSGVRSHVLFVVVSRFGNTQQAELSNWKWNSKLTNKPVWGSVGFKVTTIYPSPWHIIQTFSTTMSLS